MANPLFHRALCIKPRRVGEFKRWAIQSLSLHPSYNSKEDMKILACAAAVFVVAFVMPGCAFTIPHEMKLLDPSHRKSVNHPGKNIDAMRLACAETMLNMSPATEATEIDARVVTNGDLVVAEVDAVLPNLGLFSQSLGVTYFCEYREGFLTFGTWTRGLKGTQK